MAVITLSREFGSGGRMIARRVCEALDYRFFDKQLIMQVAAEIGLSEADIVDYPERHYKVKSLRDRLAAAFGSGARGGEAKATAPTLTWGGLEARMDEDWCVELVNNTIRAAYKQGNVVILGRGGQAVLRDMPGVLHVRVKAPLETRLRRLQEVEGLDRREARRQIARHDQDSARYLKRVFNVDWDDPFLYHLIINTGRWEPEAAAQLVVDAARQLAAAPAPA